MNIVIPQNYQEAQQFLIYLSKLNDIEFYRLMEMYDEKNLMISTDHKYDFSIRDRNTKTQIDFEGGRLSWLKNGELHREDGPAVQYLNGDKFWRQNGKFHREDGPAVEYANGGKIWYQNGKLHREDGPAIEDSAHGDRWFIHGESLESLASRFARGVRFDAEFLRRRSFGVLRKQDIHLGSESAIKSFIEFLWQNGYQFDEYLNDYETDKSLHQMHEFDILKITAKNEEVIMSALRDFYIADKVSEIADKMEKINPNIYTNISEGDIAEAAKNIHLMMNKPTLEEIFKNWQNYDELQESFSLKSYWSYN